MTMDKSSSEGYSWLTSKTGIDLSRGGVSKVLSGFIEERCHRLGCNPESYAQLVTDGSDEEFQHLANRVTIVYTWFFRDLGQMEAIETLLSQWSRHRAMRVWVPGCATGEDAYSIALMAQRLGKPIDILGTDLNSHAIAQARAAEYSKWSVREVAPVYRGYFAKAGRRRYRLDAGVRRTVEFRVHNLMDTPPSCHGGGWDLILCRNVLIYFDRERARVVFEQLNQALEYGGHLMLGASEVVYDVPPALRAKYLASRLVLERVRPSGSPKPIASTQRDGIASAVLPIAPFQPQQLAPTRSWDIGTVQVNAARVELGAPPISPARRLTAIREDASEALLDRLLKEGNTLLEEGKLERAQQCFREAVAEESTSAAARMYFGIALYLCGQIDEAARELRAASLLDASLWPASLYLGLSYESMGLPEDALREYRHVLRLSEAEQTSRPRVHATLGAWHRDLLDLARRRLDMASTG